MSFNGNRGRGEWSGATLSLLGNKTAKNVKTCLQKPASTEQYYHTLDTFSSLVPSHSHPCCPGLIRGKSSEETARTVTGIPHFEGSSPILTPAGRKTAADGEIDGLRYFTTPSSIQHRDRTPHPNSSQG